jgi:exopolysaccharide production protein ExoZ
MCDRMPRFQSIQYLRGVAALMVVAFHVTPSKAGLIGAAGVDIFFVISGFIMWVVSTARETTAGEFLSHRILRVVPLYWAFTLLLAGTAAAVPSAFSRLQLTADHLLMSLAFIPYLDASTGKITPLLVQGWTLNYEMFFYVVMAVALLFPRRSQLAIIAFVLLSLPVVGMMVPLRPVLVRPYTDPLLLEFLAGLGIGVLWSRGLLPGKSWAMGLVAVSIAGFVLAAMAGEDAERYRVLTWGIPSGLLVLGLLSIESSVGILKFRLGALIGDASYSIYLSHTFVISIASKLLADVIADPGVRTAWFVSIMPPLCTLGGILAYKFVELPTLKRLRMTIVTLSTLPAQPAKAVPPTLLGSKIS